MQDINELQLPDLTTEGRNTFGCEVDGIVWLPFRHAGNPNAAPSRSVSISDNTVSILAAKWLPEDNEWITLTFRWEPGHAGPYGFRERGVEKAWASYFSAAGEYVTDTLHTGQVMIIDYQLERNGTRRYLSGTFEFDAKRGTSDKVSVTNGRFDLRIDD